MQRYLYTYVFLNQTKFAFVPWQNSVLLFNGIFLFFPISFIVAFTHTHGKGIYERCE